jgi:hypothetical protein
VVIDKITKAICGQLVAGVYLDIKTISAIIFALATFTKRTPIAHREDIIR